jgi:hypothetical protein
VAQRRWAFPAGVLDREGSIMDLGHVDADMGRLAASDGAVDTGTKLP